jgi:hypothetical protein
MSFLKSLLDRSSEVEQPIIAMELADEDLETVIGGCGHNHCDKKKEHDDCHNKHYKKCHRDRRCH